MAQRRTFRKRHQGARTGALRSEARKSGASGRGGFPCRSEGRERRGSLYTSDMTKYFAHSTHLRYPNGGNLHSQIHRRITKEHP